MAAPARYETVNAELFALTYGAIVVQLIKDYEDPVEVNAQLEQMGYNIGIRLVDEFCAKNRNLRCRNFRETMETVSKDAFRMFLGVNAIVDSWSPEGTACSIKIPDNPLADFVELPPAMAELRYSNILVGVLRGSLEMLSMRVDCKFVRDLLNGDDATEIRVSLREVLSEAASRDYRDE